MNRTAKFVPVALALVAAWALAPTAAEAQSKGKQNTIGQLVSGLINVNVQNVVLKDVVVVDVNDVLNDNEVEILNNVLNNSPILSYNSEILTNVLQNADIIDDTQVVVGVLSSGLFVIQ